VTLGSNTHPIIEGQYLRDILDQPRALAVTLERLEVPQELNTIGRRLREGEIKRVVLTGMGASFHALHPLFLRLNGYGYTAIAIETSELIHSLQCWLHPETLIIANSQSGQSAEVVRLIEENGSRAAVVGVTNAAESPLALQADASLLTMAGAEFSVSCKSYVTALMALQLLGRFLCGCDPNRTREELAQTAPAVASYLDHWRQHVFELAPEVERVRHLFLLGRGASLAAAGEGALIIKESVRVHAEGMSSAAFRHGPLEMINGETFAVVFAGAETTRPLQVKLLNDIRKAGGKTALIAEDGSPGPWNLPKAPPGVRPVLEILPVQMMTLALAAEAGIEAGRFARIPKITTLE